MQEGLPSVSVSKLPSAVTVAGCCLCLAQTIRNFSRTAAPKLEASRKRRAGSRFQAYVNVGERLQRAESGSNRRTVHLFASTRVSMHFSNKLKDLFGRGSLGWGFGCCCCCNCCRRICQRKSWLLLPLQLQLQLLRLLVLVLLSLSLFLPLSLLLASSLLLVEPPKVGGRRRDVEPYNTALLHHPPQAPHLPCLPVRALLACARVRAPYTHAPQRTAPCIPLHAHSAFAETRAQRAHSPCVNSA